MVARDLVGARCVGSFVDRAGRVVLQFEKDEVEGSAPTYRLIRQSHEIRVHPDQVLMDLGLDETGEQ